MPCDVAGGVMSRTTLVLGGARSGKSAYAQAAAETAAAARGEALVFIATAHALDEEMNERISRHRADRDHRWTTVEAPLDLAGALASLGETQVGVVDCLTLWLSNCLLAETLDAQVPALLQTLPRCAATLWLVSNEVGWGVVPDNALARRFRDEAGRLNQAVAAIADRVVLVAAGLPLTLKPGGD
jgi:adenosylcobinamide kinase / adenosylcobinamide-phosphate guanylyltransferase